jgi:hypothetical protein
VRGTPIGSLQTVRNLPFCGTAYAGILDEMRSLRPSNYLETLYVGSKVVEEFYVPGLMAGEVLGLCWRTTAV